MEASSLYFDFGDILILFKHIHTYVRTCTYLSHWLKMTRIYQQSWLVRVLIIKLNDSFEIGSLWQSFHGKTVHPTIAQRMIFYDWSVRMVTPFYEVFDFVMQAWTLCSSFRQTQETSESYWHTQSDYQYHPNYNIYTLVCILQLFLFLLCGVPLSRIYVTENEWAKCW